MSKDNNLDKFKIIKNIFELYGIYTFRINNKDLLKKTDVLIGESDLQHMNDFVHLINQAIKCLKDDEQEIIKISFIDKVHYSKSNYSQSTFFAKRKKTSLKLYDLIYAECRNFELETNTKKD